MISRRALLAGAVASSAGLTRRAQRAGLSQPRHQGDRAVRPRRAGRHHGAARRPATVRAARPERHHRQPRWRRRHHRRQGRRRRRAGRLHADVRQHRDLRGRTRGLRQHRLRPDQEFRADRAVLGQHQSAGRRSEAAGAIGRRADRPRQGQPRQDQLRLARLRHAAAHDRRDVQAARRRRHRARALQGHRRGADRHHGGPGAAHLRKSVGPGPAHPRRQAQGARHHRRDRAIRRPPSCRP